MNLRTVLISLVGVVVLAVLALVGLTWLDDEPATNPDADDASPPSSSPETTTVERPADVPTLPPFDVNALDITLQIDDSRAPLSEVAQQFRSRVAAQPDDPFTATTLASTLLELARATADLAVYAEAEAIIDEALAVAPESIDAQLVKAQTEAARHDFSSAADRANRVLDQDPTDNRALAIRADASFELGDIDRATSDFKALHAQSPSAASASRLSRLAQLTGDPATAIEHAVLALELAQEIPLRPNGAAFYWFQLGSVLWGIGDIDAAADALDRALSIDPGHPGATELMATVRTAQGRSDEAKDIYRSLLADGGAADLHGQLAVLLQLDGDQQGADEQLQQGRTLGRETMGTFPAERRHLAGFFVDVEPALALELAEQDLETRQDIYAYDTLAWALLANDRAEEADDAMRSALVLGTIDAELYFHAGAIAAEVGDEARAAAFLSAALETNPRFDPVDAPRAAELLDMFDAE